MGESLSLLELEILFPSLSDLIIASQTSLWSLTLMRISEEQRTYLYAHGLARGELVNMQVLFLW